MPTYTKEEARAHIAALVAQFQQHEATLTHVAEAQIENDYIRPLFRYLNWNVDNRGLAEADWEFVLQKTDREGKRPDYRLQLMGQWLLFMDAKKVKYDMHDPRWITQVYAYAYSTQNNAPSRKVDFAILTDFQEFVVLDCTLHAARPAAAPTFRVLDWRYTDYVTQFDTLWELFERDNMLEASRERKSGLWSLYLSPKKVQANRIPPDQAFLADMDDEQTGWRVRLAKDMKKLNPQLDGALITAAVQLLIDRLIFVKALSDREIEDDYLAQLAEAVTQAGLGADERGWFKACQKIFAKLNDVYNGSIFEPRPELEAVQVSNKVVREVIRALQPEYSPYNFAVLPVEILGTIYERFLGRVVSATAQRVKIEEKPEVRKAGGVFYTPQYIVNTIVQHTVGKRLAECHTPDDVASLKIVDPACGSGSFLLSAYATLIDWHVRYYGDKDQLTKRDRQAAYYDADGRVRLTARLKRQILLNNIFGVDIDPQAVEVTRFSLSLKALEDTRRDELYEEVNLFKSTVLPDLSRNIQCGNSLIGMEEFSPSSVIASRFTAKQSPRHAREIASQTALAMTPDVIELKRVNPFDWRERFPQVFGQPDLTGFQKPVRSSAGGFDCVIGNPPYIRIQTLKEWAPLEVEIYKQQYVAASAGNYDIYVVFVEKGLSLLNAHGRLGFILPHKFFNSQYGEPLRRLIAQGQHLGEIVHFGDQQVFAGATTYTTLLFLDKAGNAQFDVVRVGDLQAWQAGEPQTQGTLPATAATAAEWNFAVGKSAGLFERLSQMPTKLGDVADRMAQGIRTSANEVYVLDLVSENGKIITAYSKQLEREVAIEREAVSLFLQGREIKPYRILPSGKVVIIPYHLEDGKATFVAEKDFKRKYPNTFAYLVENKSYLENREKGRMRGSNWYAFVYPKNIEMMSAAKILVPDIADRASFALDESGSYAFTSGYGITLKGNITESPKYILGLLNSKVLDFYLKKVSTTMRGGFFRYFTQFIEQLPIRPINFADAADQARHERMVQLVEAMLQLHRYKAAAQTQHEQSLLQHQIDHTDKQIDALVYELYELSDEAIRLVES